MKGFKQELSDLLYYLFSKPLLNKEDNKVIRERADKLKLEKDVLPNGLRTTFHVERLGRYLYYKHKQQNIYDNLCD